MDDSAGKLGLAGSRPARVVVNERLQHACCELSITRRATLPKLSRDKVARLT